jgi:hypothetical protein
MLYYANPMKTNLPFLKLTHPPKSKNNQPPFVDSAGKNIAKTQTRVQSIARQDIYLIKWSFIHILIILPITIYTIDDKYYYSGKSMPEIG